jgi:hypothetical protein
MKILGLNSKLQIAGLEFTVSKITKKGISVTNGKTLMFLGLDEVVKELNSKNWSILCI